MRSAGIIVVRKENDSYLFLMLRSYNYWDFPKGKIELNENVMQAALREVKEETGITILNFNWGKDYYETEVYGVTNKQKTASFFLAETTVTEVVMGINQELGKPEHEEYQWFTYSEALKHSVPRIRKVLKWANKKITEWPRRETKRTFRKIQKTTQNPS